MNGLRLSQQLLGKVAGKKGRWLPVLENELRCRIGWVDEVVSPFARARRQPKARPTINLVLADTLLLSRREPKSS